MSGNLYPNDSSELQAEIDALKIPSRTYAQISALDPGLIVVGAVIYCSDYNVNVRNMGDEFLAQSPFHLFCGSGGASVTGNTDENSFRSILVPRLILGRDHSVRVTASISAAAAGATPRLKISASSGITGTVFYAPASPTTSASTIDKTIVQNGANSQLIGGGATAQNNSSATSGGSTSAINNASDYYINATQQLVSGANTSSLTAISVTCTPRVP